MINTYLPLISRINQKLFRRPEIYHAFDIKEEIAPSFKIEHPPIIQLPDELDRVIEFNHSITRDQFVSRTRGGETTHSATVGYFYWNAILSSGSIYANRSFDSITKSNRRFKFSGKPERLSNQALATDWVIEKYFGHWLLDGQSKELLAAQLNCAALGIARKPWDQEAGYRAISGTSIHRTEFAQINGLWIVDDRSMNENHRQRMQELRRRIRSNVQKPSSSAPVFLRRVGGAHRPLLNQDQLAEALSKRGFTIITPESEPVNDLVAALSGAKLVVSVEGSALCHAIAAMDDGGTVLAIQPPRRVDWIQKIWTDCVDLRLAQTVADDRGDGFELKEDRLLRLCDLIERSS